MKKIKRFYYKWIKGYCRHFCFLCEFKIKCFEEWWLEDWHKISGCDPNENKM